MATRKTSTPGTKAPLQVETLKHADDKRKNIPTAEFQSVVQREHQQPVQLRYPRADADEKTTVRPEPVEGPANGQGAPGPLAAERNARHRDLDPQLVWRGKDQADWSELVVNAPPLYIQEKLHPKVLIDDLKRQSDKAKAAAAPEQQGFVADLFADMAKDFNGVPEGDAKTEFYAHDQHWSNRMILGDSLQVMASLAEREGLRGKVQCIYFDPPYGIKFNSNFQWSTTSRDVKDGNAEHITREPEMVKAFRDTWRDGLHSYLSYIRDRLTVARDLLTDSGSIFVQIGDENVHRVRSVMDEVFGDGNFVSQITVRKTTSEGNALLGSTCDFVIWFGKNSQATKVRSLYTARSEDSEGRYSSTYLDGSLYRLDNITSSRPAGEGDVKEFQWFGKSFDPGKGTFKTTEAGLNALARADRLVATKKGKLNYRRSQTDFGYGVLGNLWADISGAVQSRADPKIYVVQTSTSIVGRCIQLSTDPGDLVLDPTCGSGTTAYVAEQWGRRWITIDTSRVALALARARIMGARYPFYLLADSKEGQAKEGEVTRTAPKSHSTFGNIRQGFVYERVPHITLKSIANNAEIDVIWDAHQLVLEPLREQLNAALKKGWQEWEIPREPDDQWSDTVKRLHADWWKQRIARQKEIDASIAAKADHEFLYDRPYEDKKKVRVAGPFTVESLLPHRVLGVDEDDKLIDPAVSDVGEGRLARDFVQIILDNLRTAGVQQADKSGKIDFTGLMPWPGEYVCAEGRYMEGADAEGNGGTEKRAGIFIGPEFGTVSRPDLVSAAREAAEAGFDVLIACAFNYDAHSSEFNKLGRVPVLKARMNADLHMAEDLKNTGKGNLFVIFGEPDIDILDAATGHKLAKGETPSGEIQVKVNGVDVFHPNTGEVRSDGAEGIACWFIDTDYNEESFFVRHAYFLGASDPYKSLKTTLKAEINAEAWESLNSDTSRPFGKPGSGRIAVKVINHLGDEVMKVFRV
ncbi:site-specific DNA-methyltransferase [Hydrogenophaga sp.]|uniref:site-specific DNA-methyltransferase n=1 Tax=Hydrogenophaga sp. TaxID=1904254 RepID=UPI001987E4A2|nr:site-specific DNA-methyltransferase [Hydrogenophaga sp.]MBD3893396.1 site-specific DNA-methyltransferase [Hydrogenophaga sp.]